MKMVWGMKSDSDQFIAGTISWIQATANQIAFDKGPRERTRECALRADLRPHQSGLLSFFYLNHLVFQDDWQTGSAIVHKSVRGQHARSTLNLLTLATAQSYIYIYIARIFMGRPKDGRKRYIRN